MAIFFLFSVGIIRSSCQSLSRSVIAYIPTDEIPKFASTVRSISEYGYDPRRVIEEFNDIQYHRDNLRAMKIIINEKQNELTKLDDRNSSLLRAISLHSNIINIYNNLANMGFDIEKLKMLHDTIQNIAESNQIGRWDAIDKFFKDIETQCHAKLGFESEWAYYADPETQRGTEEVVGES